jgi:hypothetical protein
VTTANPTTPPPSRSRRRPLSLRALLLAGVAAALLAGLSARPAQAHVPIVLLVMAPQDGQTVAASPRVVIYAQRTLGGVDQVAYTLTLDQHPIDPTSGRTGTALPAQIRAGQQTQVQLHDLKPGQHQLALRYRPDKDEPVMGDTVAFTVTAPAAAHSQPAVPIAAGLALAAVAGATTWWVRRRRRGAGRPVRGGSADSNREQQPQLAEQADLRLATPQRRAASTGNTRLPGATNQKS